MYIFRKLMLTLFITLPGIISERIDNSQCVASKKLDEQCSRYCYGIVKPLLQYASTVRSKEDQFTALNNQILNLEATIKLQENQLQSCNSHEKYYLTKDDLLASNKALVVQIKDLIILNNNNESQEKEIETDKNNENQLKIELKNKDSEILNLKSQEVVKTDKIMELENRLTKKEKVIETDKNNESQLKMELKNKDSEILNLKSQEVEKTDKIKELENRLTEKEMKIETHKNNENQLKMELKNKDSEISNLKSQVVDKLGKITELENKLTEKEKEIRKCLPSSCIGKETGIYEIQVPGSNPFTVPCDATLIDSGWTVIQRRKDGSENFNRGMRDYRLGFGKLNGEFFVGLDKLHLMTKSQKHELFIYMKRFNNEVGYARYSHFLIGGEDELFKLKSLGGFSGNAGDSLSPNINMKFTTRDSGDWRAEDCAKLSQGGWWFNGCGFSYLNSYYWTNLQWRSWTMDNLKFVQIMIRPIK